MPSKLTVIQKEILIGSLLGDGCLFTFPRSSYPVLAIRRSLRDYKYLQYEYNAFKPFCKSPITIGEQFDPRTKKAYKYCRFITRNSPPFSEFQKKWYPKGKKIIPKTFQVSSLTPLICSIWFCDDGCVQTHPVTNRLSMKLSTHGFSKKDNIRLIKILSFKFKSHFSLVKENKKYYIKAADFGTTEFIKYIEKHIPKSMSRKITWSRDQLNSKKSFSHLKNRSKYEFTKKELEILFILKDNSKLSASKISKKMNWKVSLGRTPSGIFMYLNRFLKNGILIKKGTPNSYIDTLNYSLTKKGRYLVNKLSNPSFC